MRYLQVITFSQTIRSSALLSVSVLTASTALASNIYVNDGTAIYSYTPAGVRTVFSNQPGSTVLQMAFDGAGNLFAAARDKNAIYEYSSAGVRSTFATVSSPYGLAIDSSGNVYTAANSGTIMKYTPGGTGSVFANTNLS